MVNVVVPSLWDSDDDSEDEQPAEPETIKSPDVVKQDDFHVLDDDGRPCRKRKAAATKGPRVTRLRGTAQIDLTIDDDEPAPTPSPSPAKPTARTASLQQPKPASDAPAAAQSRAPASVAELSKETRYNLERSQKLMASMSALQRDEVDLEEELSPAPAFVPRLVTRQHRYEPLPLPQPLQQPVQPPAAATQGGGSSSDAAAGPVAAAPAETEHKLQLHLKHKHGEFKVRIKPGDTFGRLLSVFLHLAAEKKVPCPTDPKAFKIMFDGDKVETAQTIADLDLEEGDCLDVTWKSPSQSHGC